MIIMLAVNGQNVWSEEDGQDMTAHDVFGVLKENGVDDKTAYGAIGCALVEGNSDVTTAQCVMSISIG